MNYLHQNQNIIKNGYYYKIILITTIPFLIGVVAFFLLVGPRVLNTSNIAFMSAGDPAQHYLGWLFFRNSGWTFPLGLNPSYGMELGSAIIYSDSIPLFALLFKLFSSFLPEVFQYFGIWLLVCFILQAFFGWKLVGLISESLIIRSFGAGLFTFSPPMLWRLHGHMSLLGHFLILASLWLVFKPKLQKRKIAWGILLAVSPMIHGYFPPMVAALWIADLLGRKWKNELTWKQIAIELFILISVTGIVCWQTGYFTARDGIATHGFGYYRMNLLSIFDSSGWSYILKDIPEAGGDYEGFNYLGLGVIFLLAASIFGLLNAKNTCIRVIHRYPFLLALVIGLTLFALSNKVGIGLWELKYPLPKFIVKLGHTFRSSGRMFWPVFYIIVFSSIFFVVRCYPKRIVPWLIGLALVMQVADTHATWKHLRKKQMTEPTSVWKTPLLSPFWDIAALRYNKLRRLLPMHNPQHWIPLGAYAGTHNMATNFSYLARTGAKDAKAVQKKMKKAIENGEYEQDSLYVLDNDVVMQAALTVKKSDLLTQIDGFNVLAPGWKHCATCSPFGKEIVLSDLLHNLSSVRIGEKLLFAGNTSPKALLVSGWSVPENWGRWSDGTKAILVLSLPANNHATSLQIEAIPHVNPKHIQQTVEIRINGITTRKITLAKNDVFEVKIPKESKRPDGKLFVEFALPDAISPKKLGISRDDRDLGIGLIALTIR